jgi:hypothetical protein
VIPYRERLPAEPPLARKLDKVMWVIAAILFVYLFVLAMQFGFIMTGS